MDGLQDLEHANLLVRSLFEDLGHDDQALMDTNVDRDHSPSTSLTPE
jgi:hypothetical protein